MWRSLNNMEPMDGDDENGGGGNWEREYLMKLLKNSNKNDRSHEAIVDGRLISKWYKLN